MNADGRSWPGRDEVARSTWIRRQAPKNRALIRALQRDLDPGESESIALAVELGTDLILLDEQDGRRLAQQQGLKPMGVVGVLLLSKQRSMLQTVRPCLDALRTDAGFWLSDSVYRFALQKAGESP